VTDKKFCRICGELIPLESKFCLKCGADLSSTPTPQREATLLHSQQNEFSDVRSEYIPSSQPYSQPYPPPRQGLLSDLGASFWLGFVGGVFGILGGVFAWMMGSVSEAFNGSSGDLYALGFGAIIFAILGIVGGVFEKKPKIGGSLMIVAAIGILISISLLGVLSCILFFVGGILVFARSRR
jgi:hypothetical protein